VTSVLGVGIGAPEVQNESVVAVIVLVVVCAIDIGNPKTIISRNDTAILITAVEVEDINNINYRRCRSST
jgi:hypothetical protein